MRGADLVVRAIYDGAEGDARITRLVQGFLAQARDGYASARDAAYELVYAELKRLAHRELARQRGATLCTTALVHEANVRLSGSDVAPADRRHASWRHTGYTA